MLSGEQVEDMNVYTNGCVMLKCMIVRYRTVARGQTTKQKCLTEVVDLVLHALLQLEFWHFCIDWDWERNILVAKNFFRFHQSCFKNEISRTEYLTALNQWHFITDHSSARLEKSSSRKDMEKNNHNQVQNFSQSYLFNVHVQIRAFYDSHFFLFHSFT